MIDGFSINATIVIVVKSIVTNLSNMPYSSDGPCNQTIFTLSASHVNLIKIKDF